MSSKKAETKRTKAPWLAYGDLRGNMEPCGCDPRTDLGGVRRLASLFAKEKVLAPQTMILSLGNNEPDRPSTALEIQFLLEATASYHPFATLYNVIELENSPEQNSELYKKLNYVLTNVKKSADLPRPSQMIITNDTSVVLGYVSPKNSQKHGLLPFTKHMGQEWQKIFDHHPKKMRVLLFSGNDQELKDILAQHLFDQIIRSNTQPFLSDFDHREHKNAGKLLDEKNGVRFDEVPLGGLGVLRGGGAEAQVARPLEQLLKPTECPPGRSTASCLQNKSTSMNKFASIEYITWLEPKYEDGEILKDLFEKIKNFHAAEFDKLTEQRRQELPDSPYIGAESCKGCHKSAYNIWAQSKHAHAHDTLVQANKDKEIYCVSCHVVGLEEKGGFAGMKHSPHLANVQCESCHGPRREHALNPKKRPQQPIESKSICVTCHKGAHSPGFEYDSYWQKIQHKR